MGGCGFCSGSYISTHFNISRTKTLFRPQPQTKFVGKWPSRIRVCSRWSESWLLLVRLQKFAHMQFETMCKAERCNGAKTTLFAVGQATYSRGRMFIRVCAEWMLYSHVKCSVSTSMVFSDLKWTSHSYCPCCMLLPSLSCCSPCSYQRPKCLHIAGLPFVRFSSSLWGNLRPLPWSLPT